MKKLCSVLSLAMILQMASPLILSTQSVWAQDQAKKTAPKKKSHCQVCKKDERKGKMVCEDVPPEKCKR